MPNKAIILQNGKAIEIPENEILENTGSFAANYFNPVRIYSSPSNATTLTTGALTANRIYSLPLILEKKSKIIDLRVNVTTAVPSNLFLAIYSDSNVYPNQKLIESTAISTATTGIKIFSIPGGLILDKGLYWLSLLSSSNPSVRCFNSASLIPILGLDPNLSTVSGLGYTILSSIFLNPYPGGASVITTNPIPTIGARIL